MADPPVPDWPGTPPEIPEGDAPDTVFALDLQFHPRHFKKQRK